MLCKKKKIRFSSERPLYRTVNPLSCQLVTCQVYTELKDLRIHLSLVNFIYNSCEATTKKIHYLRDDSVMVSDIVMSH